MNSSSPPKRISVCLASFNGEKYIREQISSILKQLSKDDELIISDDCSTDQTVNIISEYIKSDSRITLLTQTKNLNFVRNFEESLKVAKGKYIFLADQDDIWLDDKVAELLPLLSENMLIVHDAVVTDNEGNILLDSLFLHRQAKAGFWHNLYKNGFTGCCMAFRRELLVKSLPFPTKLNYHDQWLGLVAQIYGSVKFYSKSLILYRRHQANLSYGLQSRNSFLKQVFNRLILLKQLFLKLLINGLRF